MDFLQNFLGFELVYLAAVLVKAARIAKAMELQTSRSVAAAAVCLSNCHQAQNH